jgi:hypothetical protein
MARHLRDVRSANAQRKPPSRQRAADLLARAQAQINAGTLEEALERTEAATLELDRLLLESQTGTPRSQTAPRPTSASAAAR